MIYAGILAGGKGLRMGIPDLPKQFLMLNDRPIIIHTIEQFLLIEDISVVCVAIHPDWVSYFEELVLKYLPKHKDTILITEGGNDRNESIMQIIKTLQKTYSITEDDILITHDSVRPFVTRQIIMDNINTMEKYDVVDTVVLATDTIVVSKDSKQIDSIPERSQMYQGQTPQSFKMLAFEKIYQTLTQKQKDYLTDACKVFVLNNVPVGLVNGAYDNLKITTITDLKVAKAMLAND